MFNISIFVLTILILISQNIILLNEETLILVCFIAFIWALSNRIGLSTKGDLNNQSNSIHTSIKNSFDQLLVSLNSELATQNQFKNLIFNFESLKKHLLYLNLSISSKLQSFTLNRYQETYEKKLVFTQRIENQTSKLLAILVVKKLKRAIYLKKYYLSIFKLPLLSCTYKISLREYFEEV